MKPIKLQRASADQYIWQLSHQFGYYVLSTVAFLILPDV